MEKKLVIVVMAAVVVIGFLAGCAEKPPEVTPTPSPVLTPTPEVTPAPSPVLTPTPVVAAAISCYVCHDKEKTANLEKHTKGGLLVNGTPGCYDYWGCHGGPNVSVHTVHPASVGCVVCHGKIPTIPSKGPGGTTCEECHGSPDPLTPSGGSLVEIHLSRGKDCQVCHVGEISQIHKMK